MKPILVVVGVTESRRRLVNILLQAGYDVAEADTGQRALEIAHCLSPKLIFMSIVMPDVTGLEIAAKLRRSVGRTSPPIVLLGSIPPIGINDEPLASLVTGYLNLDVSSRDLLATVRSQLAIDSQ